MPESAIASGCIDFVLSPEEIAEKIVQIADAVSRAAVDAPLRAKRSGRFGFIGWKQN